MGMAGDAHPSAPDGRKVHRSVPGKKAIGLRLRKAREAPPYWSRPDLARLLRAAADPATGPACPMSAPRRDDQTLGGGEVRPRSPIPAAVCESDRHGEDDLFGADEALTPTIETGSPKPSHAPPSRPHRRRLLATILAAQRRLNDTADPAAILPATLAQTDVATTLLQAARGPVRDALAPVAAEYVQFSGWLRAEHRDDQRAAHLLTDAEALADDAGSGELAAQAVNFKGYLARQQGNARGVVRHFLTAYHTPGAAPAAASATPSWPHTVTPPRRPCGRAAAARRGRDARGRRGVQPAAGHRVLADARLPARQHRARSAGARRARRGGRAPSGGAGVAAARPARRGVDGRVPGRASAGAGGP